MKPIIDHDEHYLRFTLTVFFYLCLKFKAGVNFHV
jgi:hypothetical protein